VTTSGIKFVTSSVKIGQVFFEILYFMSPIQH